MEHRNDRISALSVQLSIACFVAAAVYWFGEDGLAGLVFPLALIPYAPALYALNLLFLRRERSLRSLALFNLCIGLAFFAVLAIAIGWGQWKALAVAAALCLWLTGQGCGLALYPPALPRVILCLDASFLALLFSVVHGASAQAPAYQLIPACVGCAASLLGMMLRRMGGGVGARGWIFVGGTFLVMVVLVFLLVGSAAAPAGQGVMALWNMLIAAARSAGALLLRFLQWIFSLFPASDAAAGITAELPGIQPSDEAGADQISPVLLIALAVLLGAGLLCLSVWFLRRLGRLHAGGKISVGPSAPHRSRSSLRAGLRRLLASWAAYLRMRIWLVRNRNTAEGLFHLLVRRCRMSPWHKRRGETPREFLLRLKESAGNDPELSAALEELIPAVDAALYAPPGRDDVPVRSRLIRRRIGASVRRQFLRKHLSKKRASDDPRVSAADA